MSYFWSLRRLYSGAQTKRGQDRAALLTEWVLKQSSTQDRKGCSWSLKIKVGPQTQEALFQLECSRKRHQNKLKCLAELTCAKVLHCQFSKTTAQYAHQLERNWWLRRHFRKFHNSRCRCIVVGHGRRWAVPSSWLWARSLGPALLWARPHVSNHPTLAPGLTSVSLRALWAQLSLKVLPKHRFFRSLLPFMYPQGLAEDSDICIWPGPVRGTLIQTACLPLQLGDSRDHLPWHGRPFSGPASQTLC